MNDEKHFSHYFYNPATFGGIVLTILIVVVEAVLFGVDALLGIDSPYFGLVMYLVMPPFLVIGILMIPAGAWWTKRRLSRDPNASVLKNLHVDFSKPTHRHTAIALFTGGIAFMVLSGVGMYHTYHFTESVTFCGEVCHKVMKPEYTAYQSSAHAHVKCASCHIGAGASYFAKSKITGSYQIYSVLMGKYPRPIPTPVRNLRPAQETCEQCHWPQQFYSPIERTYSHFLSDEKNTPAPVRLMVNVGGGRVGKSQTGIHLHMNINHLIEYIPLDDTREIIAWVRATDRVTGEVHEYRSKEHPLSDTEIAAKRIRRMDCIDCHNRPAHKFPSAQSVVNDALENGALDRELSFIKRESVRALDRTYTTEQEAMAGIAAHLHNFYAEAYPDMDRSNPKRVTDAILAVQDLYRKSQFPDMRSSWKSYPDHIGHMNSGGCFRCHGEDLQTATGKTITRDCRTCHSFLKPESNDNGHGRTYVTVDEFVHPGDVGDMWKETACHECHQGGAELY